jgi:hypothetical protein
VSARADWPTLEEFGARTMTPDDLDALARYLTGLAESAMEVRHLRLAAEHRWRESIPNRPTIGYYLRRQKEKPA